MNLTDRLKLTLAVVLFAGLLILPIIALAIGWSVDDFGTGLIAAIVTFAVALLLAAGLFLAVRRHNWFSASLPILLTSLYSLLPDVIVGPVDDTFAMTGGAALSLFFWLRKQPNVPRWIILPLAGSVVYTWLGGVLPGPIDELMVYALSGLSTLAGLRQGAARGGKLKNDDVIEGQFYDPSERNRR